MSEPWPDIGHTYDVAAEHYAATFAGELDGKPFDRDLLDRYAAARAGRGEVWDVGCGAAGHLTRYLADRGVTASGADISPGRWRWHGGAGEIGSEAAFGFPVPVRATLVSLDEITGWAESAGFTIRERHERAPTRASTRRSASTCGRRCPADPGGGQVARTKSAITAPSRSPASSCRKWPAFSMTG